MPPESNPDFLGLLKSLKGNEVDFIIVGGVCAVLHGATVATFDLDLVPSRTPKNLDRLSSALRGLNAEYRGRGTQVLVPERAHLDPPGHRLLTTDRGPLDIWGHIGAGWDHERLYPRTVVVDCEGLELRLLDLETLIRVKREVPRLKDRGTLVLLKRILGEKKRKRKNRS